MGVTTKLTEFFLKQKKIHYKRRETIFRPSDVASGVFYLQKGFVRLYSISADGQEISLIIYKPGDMFPLNWAMNNIPIAHYHEAMTSVELWKVSKEQFLDFIQEDPDVSLYLAKEMLIRFNALLERMEHTVCGTAYEKVAAVIFLCGERFGILEENKFVIPLTLTHRDIASLAGITRETASLEVKKLEKKKFISYKRHLLVVNDMNLLKKETLLHRE